MPATEERIWSDFDRMVKNTERMRLHLELGKPECAAIGCRAKLSAYAVYDVCESCHLKRRHYEELREQKRREQAEINRRIIGKPGTPVPGLYGVRKARGISQRQLAKRLGVHINTISEWERQSSHPNVENLKKLRLSLRVAEKALTS